MAAVYTSNLVINAGTDFSQVFSLENNTSSSDLNLTSYAVSALMRKHHGSSSATVFAAQVTDATAGNIRISLGSTITSSLKPGRYVYDVIITDGNGTGTKTRVIEGMALVREGVTR
jgi:hypothetical protein